MAVPRSTPVPDRCAEQGHAWGPSSNGVSTGPEDVPPMRGTHLIHPLVGGPLPLVCAADRGVDMRDLLHPDALAAFFRRNHTPEALARIVAEHEPDGDGRCQRCHVRGPCTLFVAAGVALRPHPTP